MDFNKFLFGEKDFGYLMIIGFRTLVMFLIILIFLRLMGKRGVKQLSVFELVVILGLGSAAGDPMIYDEIGVATAGIAFLVIMSCYKLLTFLVSKFKGVEYVIEGKEVCIIKEGKFAIQNFKKESLSLDEFFMELRIQSVFHLGQIEYAFLETSGNISIFFYENNQVKYGLPILPNSLSKTTTAFVEGNHYSCCFCGETYKYKNSHDLICKVCSKKQFVEASNRKRNN